MFHIACQSDRHRKDDDCYPGDNDGKFKPHPGALLWRAVLDSDAQDQTGKKNKRGKNKVINDRSEDNYCIAVARVFGEQSL